MTTQGNAAFSQCNSQCNSLWNLSLFPLSWKLSLLSSQFRHGYLETYSNSRHSWFHLDASHDWRHFLGICSWRDSCDVSRFHQDPRLRTFEGYFVWQFVPFFCGCDFLSAKYLGLFLSSWAWPCICPKKLLQLRSCTAFPLHTSLVINFVGVEHFPLAWR